jgi:hypothetical protein
MSQVNALLNVLTAQTQTPIITAATTPVPAPLSLFNPPAVFAYNLVVDTNNSRVQFSYSAFQQTNGGAGLAQVSGTSAWITLPNLCSAFPNVTLASTVTTFISGNSVVFTITTTIGYDSCAFAPFSVTVLP